MEVILVWLQIRNEFSERVVTQLRNRGYHGEQASGQVYWREGWKEKCCGSKMSANAQHGLGTLGVKV